MQKASYKPTKCLAKYIDRIYVLEQNITEQFPILLPGTGLELLFHLKNPFSLNNKTCNDAHIISSKNNVLKFENSSDIHFISVRFKCGAFRNFSPIPFSEINNSTLSINHIWGALGVQFLEKLHKIESIEQKIRLIESFLMQRLLENKQENSCKWDFLINNLYYNHTNIKISDFTKNITVSTRQFERNFKAQFGLSAKKFHKVIRFEKTVKEILLNHQNKYLTVALDNGYYDQSHFINDFKHYTGKKPSEYFVSDVFKQHHYDKAI